MLSFLFFGKLSFFGNFSIFSAKLSFFSNFSIFSAKLSFFRFGAHPYGI